MIGYLSESYLHGGHSRGRIRLIEREVSVTHFSKERDVDYFVGGYIFLSVLRQNYEVAIIIIIIVVVTAVMEVYRERRALREQRGASGKAPQRRVHLIWDRERERKSFMCMAGDVFQIINSIQAPATLQL